MNAAELLVKCLEEEEVNYIFGVPGEETLSFLEALADSPIRFIITRHEQGAALMADVYGRITGRAGVCLGTLGPGATNLLTGVADAYLDHAPLVAITGQTALERVHKESHQYIDTMDLFHSITKWQAQIAHPEVVPEVVRKAFKMAETEKPGPTHIELPENVAAQDTTGMSLRQTPIQYSRPAQEALQRAAEVITHAKQPMILAGNGVIRRGATPELRSFASRAGIPVVNTFMSKGTMPYTDSLAQLTVGLQNRDYELCGLADADVVITVGYDLVEFAPSLWNPKRNKLIVHIDTLPAEVDQYYQTEVEIVSEIGEALHELMLMCGPVAGHTGPSLLKDMIMTELGTYADDMSVPLKPQRILSDVRRVLKDEDTLISDVGAHKLWIARMFPATRPNSVIISNGFATMGIGVPGGIAARLAEPDRRVVVITGDGGFLMNMQELETACRLGTAFVTMVWVDNGYGVIRWKQERSFGRSFGVDFGNPDFSQIASAFGMPSFTVNSAEELAPALARALDLDKPSLIAVPVDYSENHRLTEALGEVHMVI